MEARDSAGNVASQPATITVASDGALVGGVLADRTGLPLAGARDQLLAGAPLAPDQHGAWDARQLGGALGHRGERGGAPDPGDGVRHGGAS